ncbi:hypothetical protein DFO70_106118 [Cytobacillus firmus]|uniref:Uncharacterized protein n=2 Tax=Cytobacillus TaxID=2675230 RepID=A0A366JV51_CYTFI|nr:hypothetical protein DFO70_106118 [Cytobacillus firmus]TDX42590.1 hypothetical protein DFO72_106118 [Cytobacillus oceanisediminis]
MNITAAGNARVILNLTVPVKNALMSIKDVPAKNAHRKFIIALARNAHSNTDIFAAVKNVPIALTINPVKQRPALLTAYFIFSAVRFKDCIKRRTPRKKMIKPIKE